MSKLIAISGGIGSGKSVISTILRIMGYNVYDCDSKAKHIMDTDAAIKTAIAENISRQAIQKDNTIDRTALANVVFNNPDALSHLNSIVHSAIRHDLLEWSQITSSNIKFVETAILYQSGLDKMVDEVWQVTAPHELRIARVMKRNGLTRNDVECRIASQNYTPTEEHHCIRTIINDLNHAVLPQVCKLLDDQKL